MKHPVVFKAVSYGPLQRRYGGKFIAREEGKVLARGHLPTAFAGHRQAPPEARTADRRLRSPQGHDLHLCQLIFPSAPRSPAKLTLGESWLRAYTVRHMRSVL